MLKGSSADFPTVFGSLLMVLLLTSACSLKPDYYGELSTAGDYQNANSLIAIGMNLAKHSAYSVPIQDRYQHEQCVYFALGKTELGERCDWYSNNGSTRGSVAVVAHRPEGSGWCTTLMNSVYHKDKWANWQDVACTSGAANQWRFVSQ
jgi:hypothetical protein